MQGLLSRNFCGGPIQRCLLAAVAPFTQPFPGRQNTPVSSVQNGTVVVQQLNLVPAMGIRPPESAGSGRSQCIGRQRPFAGRCPGALRWHDPGRQRFFDMPGADQAVATAAFDGFVKEIRKATGYDEFERLIAPDIGHTVLIRKP